MKPFNDRGPFAVGDVCILVGLSVLTHFIGMEVTISEVICIGVYRLEIQNVLWTCDECFLRRRRPPANTGEARILAQFTPAPTPRETVDA